MTEFSGGLLTNWGPHVIDQALQFIGSPVADLWADVRSVISIGDGASCCQRSIHCLYSASV